MTGAVASLALALILAVGGGGAAWASFTGSATGAVRASTLTLQPPTNLVRASCAIGFDRVLTVRFTPTTSINDVARRPATQPAQVISYPVSVVISGSGTATATLAANATQLTVRASNSMFTTRTWAVTMRTAYASWMSAPVTATFTC